MLIDHAEIQVRAGKGGDGCVSLRREKFVPKGGPDGGDGGDGGGVYAVADVNVETLLDFQSRYHWFARSGQPGAGKDMTGRKGEPLTLSLPVGALIYDKETGVLLKDLSTPGERVCLAEPGKGGRGNARFARPDHQTPREFEKGTPGQERILRLELKLIADVGLVGLPNAGKSTLLARLTHAKPKIADYPFTTLKPQLGIVELPGPRRFILADLPGLIEGAHDGAGLGDQFLRHIERTRVVVHVVDVGSGALGTDPVEAYRVIRNELTSYSEELASKPEIVLANKIDLTGGPASAEELAAEIGLQAGSPARVYPVSAVAGSGLEQVAEAMWRLVDEAKKQTVVEIEPEAMVPPHVRAALE